MKIEEIKIQIPEGYEIDEKNSCLKDGIIKFKKNELSTLDIMFKLWTEGKLTPGIHYLATEPFLEDDDCGTKLHNKMIAYARLSCIAKYFNQNWVLMDGEEHYEIARDSYLGYEVRCYHCSLIAGNIYFKTEKSAQRAIELMGDDLKYLFD